jgi:mercuric ion binding protein
MPRTTKRMPFLFATLVLALLWGCASQDSKPLPRPKPVVDRPPVEERALLSLGGKFCEFYLNDVGGALKRLTGVKAVDFTTMKGHAIVTFEVGSVSPVQFLSAVGSVKGEGYFCKAEVLP